MALGTVYVLHRQIVWCFRFPKAQRKSSSVGILHVNLTSYGVAKDMNTSSWNLPTWTLLSPKFCFCVSFDAITAYVQNIPSLNHLSLGSYHAFAPLSRANNRRAASHRAAPRLNQPPPLGPFELPGPATRHSVCRRGEILRMQYAFFFLSVEIQLV